MTFSENMEFVRELSALLNRHNIDAKTSTPDFLLADFLAGVLDSYQTMRHNTLKRVRDS